MIFNLALMDIHQKTRNQKSKTPPNEPVIQYIEYLWFYGVAAYLDHGVAASADLEAAVREQVAPVSRLVEALAHAGRDALRALDEPQTVDFRPVQVANGQSGTSNIHLMKKNIKNYKFLCLFWGWGPTYTFRKKYQVICVFSWFGTSVIHIKKTKSIFFVCVNFENQVPFSLCGISNIHLQKRTSKFFVCC